MLYPFAFFCAKSVEISKNAGSFRFCTYRRCPNINFNLKFVPRQLESAFFGALTLVGASFVFYRKFILEEATLKKFFVGLGKFLLRVLLVAIGGAIIFIIWNIVAG